MPDIPIDKLPHYLDELARSFEEPLKEGLAKCADEIRQAYASNFDSAGYSGGSWPPRKDKLPHPLLQKSLALRNAATQEGAAGNVSENDGREIAVGVEKSSSLPYTHAQHYGYKGIPPRPYIDVSESALDKCEGHIAEDLDKRLNG